MKNIFNIVIAAIIIFGLNACSNNHRSRAVEYMADTDMYNPVGYETYGTSPVFKNGMEAQTPVAGTIARNEVPYEIPNTEAGYQLAKKTLKSPLKVNKANLANGKAMFNIYCAVCHGNKGDGQGILVKREKFLGVPNYKDRDITEGSIYHVIMYGRNMMGSHASQLTYKERWQIVQYVLQLRANLLK